MLSFFNLALNKYIGKYFYKIAKLYIKIPKTVKMIAQIINIKTQISVKDLSYPSYNCSKKTNNLNIYLIFLNDILLLI